MFKWIRGFVSGITLMMLGLETLLIFVLANEQKDFRDTKKSFVTDVNYSHPKSEEQEA